MSSTRLLNWLDGLEWVEPELSGPEIIYCKTKTNSYFGFLMII